MLFRSVARLMCAPVRFAVSFRVSWRPDWERVKSTKRARGFWGGAGSGAVWIGRRRFRLAEEEKVAATAGAEEFGGAEVVLDAVEDLLDSRGLVPESRRWLRVQLFRMAERRRS